MNSVEIVRKSLADSHWLLEQTVGELSDEQLHFVPPGTAHTIAATYAHVVGSEDTFVQSKLLGKPLLAESAWSERSGISLPIPERESDWLAWSRNVRVDLPLLRRYAEAVYAQTDAYLASLTPERLGQMPDAPIPGNQTLAWLILNMLTLHAAVHTGEIAVVKGLLGLRGYP